MASERDAGLVERPKLQMIDEEFGLHRKDASEYIGELAGELAGLARRSDLPILAYLLDVATLEAKTKAHELADALRKPDRLTEVSS